MESYYMVVMEEYDFRSESSWRIEREGLFKTYLEAAQYLIDEGFDVFCEKAFLSEEYELYYEIPSYRNSEYYEGYIEEWKVK